MHFHRAGNAFVQGKHGFPGKVCSTHFCEALHQKFFPFFKRLQFGRTGLASIIKRGEFARHEFSQGRKLRRVGEIDRRLAPEFAVCFRILPDEFQRPDTPAHVSKLAFQGKFRFPVRCESVAEAEGTDGVVVRCDIYALGVRVCGQKKAQCAAVLIRLEGEFFMYKRSAGMQQNRRRSGESGSGGQAGTAHEGQGSISSRTFYGLHE